MAITLLKYVDRVVRLGAERGIVLDEANVESTLPIALLHLQRQAKASSLRGHFEKTSSAVTLTSGVASLAALTDLPYDAISSIVHSDGTQVSLLPPGATLRDLAYPRNTYTYWAAIVDDSLLVYRGTGVVAANGTVTIVYVAILTVTTVPDQVVPDLIEAGLALAQQAG